MQLQTDQILDLWGVTHRKVDPGPQLSHGVEVKSGKIDQSRQVLLPICCTYSTQSLVCPTNKSAVPTQGATSYNLHSKRRQGDTQTSAAAPGAQCTMVAAADESEAQTASLRGQGMAATAAGGDRAIANSAPLGLDGKSRYSMWLMLAEHVAEQRCCQSGCREVDGQQGCQPAAGPCIGWGAVCFFGSSHAQLTKVATATACRQALVLY